MDNVRAAEAAAAAATDAALLDGEFFDEGVNACNANADESFRCCLCGSLDDEGDWMEDAVVVECCGVRRIIWLLSRSALLR